MYYFFSCLFCKFFFFFVRKRDLKPKLFTASASWPLQVIMAFSFSSLFSELSPSGESRKMRKKWPHNHANQIRTWCLKGKILNCEMIHKKVEVSETLKREKKNKNLCVLHFFQELDIFSWKWFSTSMTREKCEAYTFTYEIRYHQILSTYLLFF